MEDESNERFISHAVPWEMAIKLSLGKLSLQVDYDVIFPDVLDANGFRWCHPGWNITNVSSHCHVIMAIHLTG